MTANVISVATDTPYAAVAAATIDAGVPMILQARHVQGVVAVRDRLDYPASALGAFDALVSFPVD